MDKEYKTCIRIDGLKTRQTLFGVVAMYNFLHPSDKTTS